MIVFSKLSRPFHSRQSTRLKLFNSPDSLAWALIFGLVLLTVLILAVKAGVILRYGFPALATLVAIVLFQRFPYLYVGYTWWIWFLTPFIRRLSDWQAGYQETSPILLTPFLVTLLTGLTLVKKLPTFYRDKEIPLLLVIAGIAYALLIGLVNRSAREVAIPFLTWATPVLFAVYLFDKWRDYPAYSRLMRRVFLWMVLLLGAYGVYQYVIAPEWDTSWLTNSGLTSSGGKAEPYGMRVFSTLNSTAPFAVVMMSGLLLLFSTDSPLQLPATAVGYLSFLLSLVRAGWFGWTVGFLTLMTSLKPKLQIRLFLIAIAMILCVTPLLFIGPFAEVVRGRLETFTDLNSDISYQGRNEIYEAHLNTALSSPLGAGLGGSWQNVDSGVIDTMIQLGWFGGILYFGGMLMLMWKLFQSKAARSDGFMSAAKGICLSIFSLLLFGTYTQGLSGVVFWVFLILGVAGQKYYLASAHPIRTRQPFIEQP
jgi:hypothetical protein